MVLCMPSLKINSAVEIGASTTSLGDLLSNVSTNASNISNLSDLVNNLSSLISYNNATNNNWLRIGPIQICYGRLTTSKTGNSSTWGNTWWGSATWTYPKSFSSQPTVIAVADDSASGLFGAAINGTPGTSNVSIESYASANYTNCVVNCIAIGLWQ